MELVLKKLQLKEQSPVLVLNAPTMFGDAIKGRAAEVYTGIKGKYDFIIAFAKDLQEMKKFVKDVTAAIEKDGYLWICYPKGSSKKYKSDINRTKLLEVFGPFNFEGVTQISIDDDWSTVRVRPVDEIRTMKRTWAMSEKGKERIRDNKK